MLNRRSFLSRAVAAIFGTIAAAYAPGLLSSGVIPEPNGTWGEAVCYEYGNGRGIRAACTFFDEQFNWV